MRWFLGVIAFLLVALILQSGLLAYAMYVLLGLLLLSRWLARSWIGNLSATRTASLATSGSFLPYKHPTSSERPLPWP